MARNVEYPGRPTQTVVRESPPIDRVYAPDLTKNLFPWMDEAACLPYGHRDAEWCELPKMVAKAICAECPVLAQCLERSVRLSPIDTCAGVWAGLTPKKLNLLRNKAAKAAA